MRSTIGRNKIPSADLTRHETSPLSRNAKTKYTLKSEMSAYNIPKNDHTKKIMSLLGLLK